MAVKIRLQRHGTKHAPVFRLVAADSRMKRDGRFLEILGTYIPQSKDAATELRANLERIDYWLGVGALPSETAHTLIKRVRKAAAATAPAGA